MAAWTPKSSIQKGVARSFASSTPVNVWGQLSGIGNRTATGAASGGLYAAAATAPAPAAAAAPPAPVGLPIDPTYDAELAGYQQQYGDTLATSALSRQQALSNAGYAATYGADGAISGLAFDASNPYSRASLAKKMYDQAKAGTKNSLAARGQLYSGAMVNAQNNNDFKYAADEDARQKALQQFLARSTLGDTQAKNTLATNKSISDANRLVRATGGS